MTQKLQAFEIEVDGQILDYRVGTSLDLIDIGKFFEKEYTVESLHNEGRHVLGELVKDDKRLFLKIATTPGIGAMLENERRWNDEFHRTVIQESSAFHVPKNVAHGLYQGKFPYLITEALEGRLIVEKPDPAVMTPVLEENLESIIRFSEFIQTLPVDDYAGASDYRERFLMKVHAWFDAVPADVRSKYRLEELLHIVEAGAAGLVKKPRHGDFAPWHLMTLSDNTLGLLDGEHFMPDGVGYYDIGYCIQRIYAVLQQPKIAEKLYAKIIDWGYDEALLSVILAARGIGGYLDASLSTSPDYAMSFAYQIWVAGKNR
jgi:hypothetical protein